MLSIWGFQAFGKANLPRTLGQHCPKHYPHLLWVAITALLSSWDFKGVHTLKHHCRAIEPPDWHRTRLLRIPICMWTRDRAREVVLSWLRGYRGDIVAFNPLRGPLSACLEICEELPRKASCDVTATRSSLPVMQCTQQLTCFVRHSFPFIFIRAENVRTINARNCWKLTVALGRRNAPIAKLQSIVSCRKPNEHPQSSGNPVMSSAVPPSMASWRGCVRNRCAGWREFSGLPST